MLAAPRRGGPDAPCTIEQMAAEVVVQLRAVQPAGPYRLGGFCRGGLIAYEMACQLREQGELVERLVLLETWTRNSPLRLIEPLLRVLMRARTNEASVRRRATLLWFLRYYPARLAAWGRTPWREHARWLRDRLLRGSRPGGMQTGGLEDAPRVAARRELRKRVRRGLKRRVTAAVRAYIPRRYDGQVDVMVATKTQGSSTDTTRGWGRVARVVRVHEFKTTRKGLVAEALPEVAARMRVWLVRQESAGRE